MLTKIAIATRVKHLDEMLKAHRATAHSQQDERAKLVEACRAGGDHVPEYALAGSPLVVGNSFYRCEFCRVQMTTPANQVSRNLLRA